MTDVQRMLRPLREVWLKVGLEKLENYEGIAVKALLDSGATGLFMDTTFAKKKGFKMEKLKNPLLVKNVDRMAMLLLLCSVRLLCLRKHAMHCSKYAMLCTSL